MKKRYLKILQLTIVYSKHELNAEKIDFLSAQQIVQFTREKRRNGTNWMEIYLNDNTLAYIIKQSGTFYQCENVALEDEIATGLFYTQKNKTYVPMPFNKLFFPQGHLNPTQYNLGQIKFESIKNTEGNKKVSIDLEYNKDIIDVKSISFRKDDEFYITNKTYTKKDIFMEVDNFNGKQGFLLKKTNVSYLEMKWVNYVFYAVTILTVLVIFAGFLSNNLIVVSGLMVVVGIAASAILVIVLLILKGIFHHIRKRY